MRQRRPGLLPVANRGGLGGGFVQRAQRQFLFERFDRRGGQPLHTPLRLQLIAASCESGRRVFVRAGTPTTAPSAKDDIGRGQQGHRHYAKPGVDHSRLCMS